MFVLLFLFCKASFPLKLLSCFWNLCFQPFDSFNRPFQVLFHPSSLCPPSPPPPSPPLPIPCWDVTEQKMCMSCSVMDVFFHTGRSVQLFRAHRVRVTPLTMTAWGRCGCCILLCHLIVVFCVHACTCSHRFLLSVKPLSKRQTLKVGCWGFFWGLFFANTRQYKNTEADSFPCNLWASENNSIAIWQTSVTCTDSGSSPLIWWCWNTKSGSKRTSASCKRVQQKLKHPSAVITMCNHGNQVSAGLGALRNPRYLKPTSTWSR